MRFEPNRPAGSPGRRRSWYRNDPPFGFDELLLRSTMFGAACMNFVLGCLDHLARVLAVRGLLLQWRRGEPVEEVVAAARAWKATAVYRIGLDYPAPIVDHRQARIKSLALGKAAQW